MTVQKTAFSSRWNYTVTDEDCKRAVKKLKSNKAVGLDCKYAPEDAFIHLAGLCNGILIYGTFQLNFVTQSCAPIVKGLRGDRNSMDNYRGIALSSVVGKLIDNVLMVKYRQS